MAIMHDLYKLPWQNNPESKSKKFMNKHGFRHPIEAVINSIKWFADEFKNDKEAKIIIDGIVHHMWPLPVRVLSNIDENNLELKNYKALENLSKKHQQMIIESSNRCKIGSLSFAKSKYIEGRILSKADKKVSFKQFESITSILALITGKNKKLKNNRR